MPSLKSARPSSMGAEMEDQALFSMLAPASIAVVGASRDPAKRGFRSVEKLLSDGYAGSIYPVNPRETEILGIPCYPEVGQCPAPADLALICTPAHTVADIVRECGAAGIRSAVVLAGGFAEAGESGQALEAGLRSAAREAGVRVMGPNTSGMFNTHQACNLVGFAHLKPGDIGLLSQSGNMALALVTEAQANGHLGLSTYVGVGNESDLQFHEYLEYFAHDAHTKVVIAYIEGLKQGRAFLDTLARVTRHKPVVVFKAGRSRAGVSSARSHTGALAGDHAVSTAVLAQAGAVLVHRSDDILPVAEALSLLAAPRSGRIAILADGGGHATIAADALVERGLALASLAAETTDRLAGILPSAASLANPVDVAGGTDADPGLFERCTRILLEDPGVDALLITGLYGGYASRFSDTLAQIELDTAAGMGALVSALGKPVLVHSLYANLHGKERPAPLEVLRDHGVPVHGSLERAVECLRALCDYGAARSQQTASPRPRLRPSGVERLLRDCAREGRSVVLEHEARAALEEAGVSMPPFRLARSAREAELAFREMGSVPVAMKIVSRDILHKTEVGGVRLGLDDETGVRAAYDGLMAAGRRHAGPGRITGVLLTPMADPRAGVEVILGVVHDATYGPVMMFGLGGVFVETLKDVIFRALPLHEADAHAMIRGIAAHELLQGVRGAPAVDEPALVQLMLAVSDLCAAFPEIAELDLNPVLALPQGLHVLDARILLQA